ncbi:MAG: hypothetical protein ACLR5G_05975 [Eubacteriales bacterium]
MIPVILVKPRLTEVRSTNSPKSPRQKLAAQERALILVVAGQNRFLRKSGASFIE